jgi:hypothetical protein
MFWEKGLRTIFGSEYKVQKDGENWIMRSFIIYTLHQILLVFK